MKHGKDTTWKFCYTNDEESCKNPYFNTLDQVNISDVLEVANQHSGFLNSFTHVLGQYAKQNKNNQEILASFTAFGTNMGLAKMGQISDINYQRLLTTSQNFIYPETLKKANDCVSNAIAKLPIFQYYNIGDVIHSSNDGQNVRNKYSYYQFKVLT